MHDHSGSPSEGSHAGEKRFDDEAARRILRRAAEEQARQENEEVGSFTLEELQKIATEAGISPEAVRAAASELEAGSERTNPALPVPGERDGGGDGGGWLAALKRRMPASWSPAAKNVVLLGVGVALVGLLVSIVGVGPVVFTLSAVILVLVFLLILVGVGL
jgi:Flp pilus assembly protein TadB